jgi:hypothetical protein
MRFLLAGILAILPLTAQAESSVSTNAVESDADSVATPSDTEYYCHPHNPIDEVRFCSNPYSPASPTNFEALIGPYLYVQGRGDVILYDPRFPSMFDFKEEGLHSLGSVHNRDLAGLPSGRGFPRMPAATPAWSTVTHDDRNQATSWEK